MPYAFEQLRVHFIEHAVRRVRYEGDTADVVIAMLRSELQEELTDDEHLELRDRINYLSSETEKLLRSRIPHDVAPSHTAIELWGFQQIQPLTPNIYVRHNQPTQQDIDHHFQTPDGEVWIWNVIYTTTGPYYGVQTNADGIPSTHYQDLGSASFVFDLAAALKSFKGFELLGDLTLDNIDGFTLEFDECKAMYETLRSQGDAITAALTPVVQGDQPFHLAQELISVLASPLQSALNSGIAQFKRGKPL
jgi:hypothetical protein